MAKSKAKLHVASKFNVDQLNGQPLFATNPETVLPLLCMIGQAQLSIDDLLGQISRSFLEQMLVLSAQSVAGTQHKGRHTGEVRWHYQTLHYDVWDYDLGGQGTLVDFPTDDGPVPAIIMPSKESVRC